MSWPCADKSAQPADALVPIGYVLYRCATCGHHACMTGHPCETCATNQRIDKRDAAMVELVDAIADGLTNTNARIDNLVDIVRVGKPYIVEVENRLQALESSIDSTQARIDQLIGDDK